MVKMGCEKRTFFVKLVKVLLRLKPLIMFVNLGLIFFSLDAVEMDLFVSVIALNLPQIHNQTLNPAARI